MISGTLWVPTCTSGASFFEPCFEHAKMGAKMEFKSVKTSPWGPLKVQNTSTRIRYKVPGHSTRCVQVWVRGAKCRCGVQVQGKRYRKGTRYTAHKSFEQASLEPLSTRRTRKRGGGYVITLRIDPYPPHSYPPLGGPYCIFCYFDAA